VGGIPLSARVDGIPLSARVGGIALWARVGGIASGNGISGCHGVSWSAQGSTAGVADQSSLSAHGSAGGGLAGGGLAGGAGSSAGPAVRRRDHQGRRGTCAGTAAEPLQRTGGSVASA
jgi:hypothetical protein